MAAYQCWSLPDGSPERSDRITAVSPDEAARTFGELWFHESEGEWMGGDVMVGSGDPGDDVAPLRYSVEVDIHDPGVSVRVDRRR